MPSPNCRTCGKVCADFKELAKHILQFRKTHKAGLKWAKKFLSNTDYLDRKVSMQSRSRIPLTEEQKDLKESLTLQLSGKYTLVKTICPNRKCRRQEFSELPIEYIESPLVWRENEILIKLCSNCGG